MTRALFLCDGATAPDKWRKRKWDFEHSIHHRDAAQQNLNLRLQNLGDTVLTKIESRAADLVRIAAYAYAADQHVSRGGTSSAYNSKWRRNLHLVIPVGDRDFWADSASSRRLSQTLSFLSDDHWEFAFTRLQPHLTQQPLRISETSERQLMYDPDSVVLFSGGADSLCATVDQVTNNARRPLLVSHRPAPNIDSQQKSLVEETRNALTQWKFPHIGCWVHRRKATTRESSLRSRSFLFASLATAIAHSLGIKEVILADNGVISLNLPFNDQLVGALNTRSTHPKFLFLFNDLVHHALGDSLTISNPLWNRTRAGSLEILRDAGVPELLEFTVSCANARAQIKATPHCGICLQCLDRRVGALAAGIEEHDLGEFYKTDVFRHPIDDGPDRSLAVSLVRFARRVNSIERDEVFFDEFPQLHDCVLPNDPDFHKTAAKLIGLLRRWSDEWIDVLDIQVSHNSRALVEGQLSPDSLLRLVAANGRQESETPDSPPAVLKHSDDYRSVTLRDQNFSFTPFQAHAVNILHENAKRQAPEVSQHTLLEAIGSSQKRLSRIFNRGDGKRAWGTLIVSGKTQGTFRLNL